MALSCVGIRLSKGHVTTTRSIQIGRDTISIVSDDSGDLLKRWARVRRSCGQ